MTKSVLLIISGSIAAYKSLDLIRRLKERGIELRCILTKGGAEFITPLSVASLSGSAVYGELFSLKDEVEMGHIRLSREADLVVVAPASADLIAKMAHGFAGDLASATLLASKKPLLVAPAMNTQMWQAPATQRNIKQITKDGATIIQPGSGMLACGEEGQGRMAEVDDIVTAVLHALAKSEPSPATQEYSGEASRPSEPSARLMRNSGEFRGGNPLQGKHALVTAGPTREAIDPVRYITNYSSGKQGYAVAEELARQGATVTLVSGPTGLDAPAGVKLVEVVTADEMLDACEEALPADVAICTAAVADWKAQEATSKIKKTPGSVPSLQLRENPDILATLAQHPNRPKLVIGFAAETDALIDNAKAKLEKKGCDWIVANDVSGGAVFDRQENQVTLVTQRDEEYWPLMQKHQVAQKLVEKIIFTLCNPQQRVKAIS
ncbi:MAG: bifunctional phosphopantothenoylcysteine decarboxylase/phosphopantothenate synthase [Alphaproteobacteria bacterium]